jgi:15-cis-phytoene synthase
MPEPHAHSPALAPDYCQDLVRRQDEDRWLAAGYAQGDAKRRLLALYAFHIELRNIPGAVSEPPLGEIRLQWWREALQEIRDGKRPRAHPVVEALADAGLADEKFEDAIERAIDAAARPLYGEGFTAIDDLTDWLATAEATFDGFAASLLGGDEALCAAAVKAGTTFALAREGANLAPALAGEIPARVHSILSDATAGLQNTPPNIAPALAHLSLTRRYLSRRRGAFPLAKRLRIFISIARGRF